MTPQEHDLLVGLDAEVGANYKPDGIGGILIQRQLDQGAQLSQLAAEVQALTALVTRLVGGLTATGSITIKPTT